MPRNDTNFGIGTLALALLASFSSRVSQRRQLRFFHRKQWDDLPPYRFVLLGEQLPSEVLDVHLGNVHTLVHSDLALRWSGLKLVTLMIGKSKRPLFEGRT